MKTVLELYKNNIKDNTSDALGIVRNMFPDITVDTFLEQRRKRKKYAKAK